MAIVMTPRLEAVQLSLEEGQRRPATETAPMSRGRDASPPFIPAHAGGLSRSSVSRLDSLVSLAKRARKEEDHLRRAEALLEVKRAARCAFDDAIADARAAGHSWRQVSARLDIPFQTLHGRFRRRPSHPEVQPQ